MDHKIQYMDLDSGHTKHCTHAIFDEAWYLQSTHLPAVQMLYNLVIVAYIVFTTDDDPHPCPFSPQPPLPSPFLPSSTTNLDSQTHFTPPYIPNTYFDL